MMRSKYKSYTVTVLSLQAAPILILIFAYLFLFTSKETLSVDVIANLQQKDQQLYLSAISDSKTRLYKLALYEKIHPNIIALGSSRVLQFRGEDFNVPFVNMGLSMSSIAQGHEIADKMLKIHTPKVVILAADFWWFSDKIVNVQPLKSISADWSSDSLLLPYTWLYEGKITPQMALSIMVNKTSGYGVSAIKWRDGFDHFGSFHYTSMLEGKRDPEHIPTNVSNLINKGKNVQYFQDRFDSTKLRQFQLLIQKFTDAGAKVIVIIPPNYPDINDLTKKLVKYNLINEFRNAIHKLPVKNFDYHDADVIKSGKCEFIDSWHGGEVTYLRILLDLARSDTDIFNVIDFKRVESLISNNQGVAEIVRSNYPIRHEIDFFKLGCSKNSRQK
jgi:hypothetical protein